MKNNHLLINIEIVILGCNARNIEFQEELVNKLIVFNIA